MKYVIIALLASGITGAAILLYMLPQVDQLVLAYEQELRVQHEYQKACEAHRMYLTHVLDNHNINYVQ